MALIALIFGLGVAVGVLGTHLFYAHRLRHPGSVAEMIVDTAAARIAGRLDLTAEQRRELDEILERAQGDVQTLRRDLIDRLRVIRSEAIDDLFAILDDDQRRELERIHETEGQILDDYLSPTDTSGDDAAP